MTNLEWLKGKRWDAWSTYDGKVVFMVNQDRDIITETSDTLEDAISSVRERYERRAA